MTTPSNPHIPLLSKAKSSWMYPIYVPSYTRAGTAKFLNTLCSAPWGVQRKVHIVVRKEELSAYKEFYPWATFVIVRKPGLGPARTRALEDADDRGYERIVMFDDDIRHLSLLERVAREDKPDYTRRHSARISGMTPEMSILRTLSVACKIVDGVFESEPTAVYGAARNALFSGDVDTSIGATLNKGTFPASVMFYDITRMDNFVLPKRFHMHGEDVAFAMDVMSRDQLWFSLPVVAFDQDGAIETTIPLDPTDPEARRVDMNNAAIDYPKIHPFLRESMKNKAGGVMRVGMYWSRWYKETGTSPIEIPLDQLLELGR